MSAAQMNKTESKVRTHPLVEEISDERGSGDGIWAYLRPGHHDGYDDLGRTHAVHEDTWTKVLSQLRCATPCSCDDCKRCAETTKAQGKSC